MVRFLVTALFISLMHFSLHAQPLHPCAQLIWQDEFDGTELDPNKWTPQIGDGCDINLCGWGNAELQYYTGREENVKVEDGKLIITALHENYGGKDYTSARIRSINQGDFNFGRIEARIKLPQGAGSWPAFWMLPTDETFGSWPQSGEIDIMEFQGKDPNAISGTVHYGNAWPDHKYKGLVYRLPANEPYYNDFHVFTIDWDSTSIKWYMDGNLYHTFTTSNILPYHWPFNERFHLILNNAIGGHLGGPVNNASFPQVMEVDYVRVYSSPLNLRIIGEKRVFVNQTNVSYYVPQTPDAIDYQWEVPSGALIVSGQNTNRIVVDWGDISSAGNISLSITQSCGEIDLILPVTVMDDAVCELILDNMDGNTNVTYDYWSSTQFYSSSTNPSTSGINSSVLAGYLTKTDLVGTNKFVLGEIPINDYTQYESGERLLQMDVYTNAAIGTTIELRLQNKNKSESPYPAGVRSILRAKTSVFRKWETLVFEYIGIEDAATLVTEIDQIAVVFDPEETVEAKYLYFDNIKRVLVPFNPISGNTSPECFAENENYSVMFNPTGIYEWTIPAGSTIGSGQGENAITVNWGNTSGRIYLKETVDGCTGYSGTLDVALNGCPLSVFNNALKKDGLTLFPNPSRDKITVQQEQKVGTPDLTLMVYNSLGEKILENAFASKSGEFSTELVIEHLVPGVYVIKLVSEQMIRSAQFVKY